MSRVLEYGFGFGDEEYSGIIDIHDDNEFRGLITATAYGFFIMFSYYILRAVRDEISSADRGNLQVLWTVVFFVMLLAIAYTWLTIANTSDIDLLTNASTTPLPIILTELPIIGFYWAAPILLIGFYAYLHLHLQRLWEDLAALPTYFPDGRPIDEHDSPWEPPHGESCSARKRVGGHRACRKTAKSMRRITQEGKNHEEKS